MVAKPILRRSSKSGGPEGQGLLAGGFSVGTGNLTLSLITFTLYYQTLEQPDETIISHSNRDQRFQGRRR